MERDHRDAHFHCGPEFLEERPKPDEDDLVGDEEGAEEELPGDRVDDTEFEEEEAPAELVRLNKYLADHGVASRRRCDELMKKGQVMVDGEIVTELGTKIDPEQQKVEIDGFVLQPKGLRKRYYLLNKPSGVVCTNENREQRPRAVDLITDPRKGRIYTVGRLDEESKGLILLTNDGDFAQRIMHPKNGIEKTYLVRVRGKIDDDAMQKIRNGIHLSEGRTSGARVLVHERQRDSSWLSVTIHEGMNREIRRSFARVGYKVIELKRTRIGPLGDRGLKIGRWRELTRAEVAALVRGAPNTDAKNRRGKGGRAPRTFSGKAGFIEAQERRSDLARQAPETSSLEGTNFEIAGLDGRGDGAGKRTSSTPRRPRGGQRDERSGERGFGPPKSGGAGKPKFAGATRARDARPQRGGPRDERSGEGRFGSPKSGGAGKPKFGGATRVRDARPQRDERSGDRGFGSPKSRGAGKPKFGGATRARDARPQRGGPRDKRSVGGRSSSPKSRGAGKPKFGGATRVRDARPQRGGPRDQRPGEGRFGPPKSRGGGKPKFGGATRVRDARPPHDGPRKSGSKARGDRPSGNSSFPTPMRRPGNPERDDS